MDVLRSQLRPPRIQLSSSAEDHTHAPATSGVLDKVDRVHERANGSIELTLADEAKESE